MKEKIKSMYVGYREKTKDMTLKEKLIGYIWEYYKLPIIVSILLIFFIGSIINTAFINPRNKAFGSLSFYGDFVSETVLENMKTELNNALVEPGSGYEIYSYLFNFDESAPAMASMQIQRFTAMVSVRELDILFAEKYDFNDFIANEFCLPLDSILSQGDIELLSDALVIDENSGLYYGIDLEKVNTDFFTSAGYYVEGKILCVILNTQYPENSASIIRYMLLS